MVFQAISMLSSSISTISTKAGEHQHQDLHQGLIYEKDLIYKIVERDEIDEDAHSWLGHHWKV